MGNFAIGQRVWIIPLHKWGVITAIEGDLFCIGAGKWGKSHLMSEHQHQVEIDRIARETEAANHQAYIDRLTVAFSEPLPCMFSQGVEYRHAYTSWANGFGGTYDMPIVVRKQYWRFMMTSDLI